MTISPDQLNPMLADDGHARKDCPDVQGDVYGHGQQTLRQIAHIDTVYPKGMAAKQPFRIEGDV